MLHSASGRAVKVCLASKCQRHRFRARVARRSVSRCSRPTAPNMATTAEYLASTLMKTTRRAQLALLGALLALALVAWLVTEDRMGAMNPTPGMALGGLGFYVTVWIVMMAAMMFPSVAPTVLMYDRLRAGHRARGKGAGADATALFVTGYLCVWTAAGLAAYGCSSWSAPSTLRSWPGTRPVDT